MGEGLHDSNEYFESTRQSMICVLLKSCIVLELSMEAGRKVQENVFSFTAKVSVIQ